MGLFPRLGIWNPVKMAEKLSLVIIRVSVQDCGQLNKVWEERLEKTKEWLLMADYCIMLTVMVDKLISKKVLPGPQQILINHLLEQIKKAFYQTHVGQSDVRKAFFDDFFENRRKLYSPFTFNTAGLGIDQDLFYEASKLLVNDYLNNIPENSKTFFIERTERYIKSSVSVIFKTKPFQELLSHQR